MCEHGRTRVVWSARNCAHVAVLNAGSLTLAQQGPVGLQAAVPAEYEGRG